MNQAPARFRAGVLSMAFTSKKNHEIYKKTQPDPVCFVFVYSMII